VRIIKHAIELSKTGNRRFMSLFARMINGLKMGWRCLGTCCHATRCVCLS